MRFVELVLEINFWDSWEELLSVVVGVSRAEEAEVIFILVSEDVHDHLQLMEFISVGLLSLGRRRNRVAVLAWEEDSLPRFSFVSLCAANHFREDASATPNVHWARVLLLEEDNFWSSVPAG